MKCMVLGTGRFKNMGHRVVSMSSPKMVSKMGAGNAGYGAYAKKDIVDVGAGLIKRKLKPLSFKM